MSGETSNDHLNLETVRSQEQLEFYREIEATGVCPFCPEHYGSFKRQKEVVHRGHHWFVFPNADRYKYTEHHLLVVPNRHILYINDLDESEWLELKDMVDWTVDEYQLEYGALAVRFGDPFQTGGSVKHMHFHILSPDNLGVTNEERVRFPMSRKIPEKS